MLSFVAALVALVAVRVAEDVVEVSEPAGLSRLVIPAALFARGGDCCADEDDVRTFWSNETSFTV